MRRMWPDEFNFLLNGAEEVTLEITPAERAANPHGEATHRHALKVRLSQEDYERIWPLAEARYRLQGKLEGKAITLITNNPLYRHWHPADGGTVESVADSGIRYTTKYVVVYFLLDDVRTHAAA